jgi:hypothetical protein
MKDNRTAGLLSQKFTVLRKDMESGEQLRWKQKFTRMDQSVAESKPQTNGKRLMASMEVYILNCSKLSNSIMRLLLLDGVLMKLLVMSTGSEETLGVHTGELMVSSRFQLTQPMLPRMSAISESNLIVWPLLHLWMVQRKPLKNTISQNSSKNDK